MEDNNLDEKIKNFESSKRIDHLNNNKALKKNKNINNESSAKDRYLSTGNAFNYHINNYNNIKDFINNYDSKIFEEKIQLFIDDNKTIDSEIIIRDYECEIKFNKNIPKDLLDSLHFTHKYFQFPIFYFFKGNFNEDSKINTITLKDYRSFKIKSENESVLNKLKDAAHTNTDFINYFSDNLFIR